MTSPAASDPAAEVEDWGAPEDPRERPPTPSADHDQLPPTGDSGGDATAAADEPPTTYYGSVYEWVTQWLLPTYTRPITSGHSAWCPRWWCHPEAVSRMESLWRAWEALRLDPALGMSVWWRDHADVHLSVMLDSTGPMKGCSPDRGHAARALPPLPEEPAPNWQGVTE